MNNFVFFFLFTLTSLERVNCQIVSVISKSTGYIKSDGEMDKFKDDFNELRSSFAEFRESTANQFVRIQSESLPNIERDLVSLWKSNRQYGPMLEQSNDLLVKSQKLYERMRTDFVRDKQHLNRLFAQVNRKMAIINATLDNNSGAISNEAKLSFFALTLAICALVMSIVMMTYLIIIHDRRQLEAKRKQMTRNSHVYEEVNQPKQQGKQQQQQYIYNRQSAKVVCQTSRTAAAVDGKKEQTLTPLECDVV